MQITWQNKAKIQSSEWPMRGVEKRIIFQEALEQSRETKLSQKSKTVNLQTWLSHGKVSSIQLNKENVILLMELWSDIGVSKVCRALLESAGVTQRSISCRPCQRTSKLAFLKWQPELEFKWPVFYLFIPLSNSISWYFKLKKSIFKQGKSNTRHYLHKWWER